jgi:hypothetical protein
MLIGNAQNMTVVGNTISGISSTTASSSAMSGIQLAFSLNGGTVSGNKISDIKNNSASGTGAFGMQISATSPASNLTIANNFISDIAALGSATVVNNGHGIDVNGVGGGGFKLYNNTINMNTNQASGTTSALSITTDVTAAGAIDLRNNIFANTQTSGATRFAVFNASNATVINPIDFNDYFAQNIGSVAGVTKATVTDWQTATGQDGNSLAVDPLFVSSSELHLQSGSPLRNAGVAGLGIATDIDGDTRDANPDIGADEITSVDPGSLQFSSATYSISENAGPAIVTVTRTGGTDGTVSVNYATSNGTATGGASCTASGVDYITTSGTLTFLNGETSKTFSVTICDDSLVEPDETINYTLSGPTNGATIGTPGTAVQTIVNDDFVLGTLSVNDVRILEGNSGTSTATFTVTYSGPNAPVSVQYATANGTATAGVDYVAANGTLNFGSLAEGESGLPTQTQNVSVTIIGDHNKEANETFFLDLSSPVNATISDGQGVGIIVDDDRSTISDFDGDRETDLSVFRPSEGRFYILQSSTGTPSILNFGLSGDIPVPGDYDGDGKTDFAVWRPSTGTWFIIQSSNGTPMIVNWGLPGDKPVQGDYDGDGKTDLAVWRPSTGTWWVLRSSDSTAVVVTFGINTDRPVQADYDGDARTDLAVYRDGTWFIIRSSDSQTVIQNWGNATDVPVTGDFDGDGKNDLTVFRNGDWWTLQSLTGTPAVTHFGLAGDVPVAADYDRDGTTDIGVFRPSAGDWYVLRSSDSNFFALHWGQNGDIPIPKAYLPQ